MKKFAVIGVGNMATSILAGMVCSKMPVSEITVYDKNEAQYERLPRRSEAYVYAKSVADAVASADCILLSVKPQNFAEILQMIREAKDYQNKLYISIAAGIDSRSISEALNGAKVVRVLPNLPMTIGMGVSLICENIEINQQDMKFVQDVFSSSGSVLMIQEEEMNRMIGVTSSSPAYVFRFINASSLP